MLVIKDFLQELDRRWQHPAASKLTLRIIGSAALMLQTDYERGTKDSDVLETASLTGETKERLLKLAGQGSALHQRHKMYLDIVASGLPFLPQAPHYHPVADLNEMLRHFEVEVLDIVDVVVGKLKRFSANDRSDIRAMVDKELVDHARLIERFKSAVDVYSMDARAEHLPDYIKNLHRVERDDFLVPETAIELPEWLSTE